MRLSHKMGKCLNVYRFEDIADQILNTVSSETDLELLIVFGSFATNQQRQESDIDIAFLSKTEISNIQRWELQEKLAGAINTDVDLVDMSKCDDVLNFQIASKGRLIYARDEKEAQAYLDLVYAKYLKLNEDRREILEYATR